MSIFIAASCRSGAVLWISVEINILINTGRRSLSLLFKVSPSPHAIDLSLQSTLTSKHPVEHPSQKTVGCSQFENQLSSLHVLFVVIHLYAHYFYTQHALVSAVTQLLGLRWLCVCQQQSAPKPLNHVSTHNTHKPAENTPSGITAKIRPTTRQPLTHNLNVTLSTDENRWH